MKAEIKEFLFIVGIDLVCIIAYCISVLMSRKSIRGEGKKGEKKGQEKIKKKGLQKE